MKKYYDEVRNVLLAGWGVALTAKEGGEKLVSKIVKEYNLNPKDARKLVNDVVADAKRKEVKIKALIKSKTKALKPTPKKAKAAKKAKRRK